MKKYFILFSFFTCIFISNNLISQNIGPSPNAASLGKFADAPVSLYNGTPSISIPLYEINSRGISVPIGISYHASGVKVEEESGVVGLGWALIAGGIVT